MPPRDKAEERQANRAAKALELERDGETESAVEVLAGRCACRCGTRIVGGSVRTFYVDERHRKRHHRAKLERLAAAAGVPARLSIETLQAARGTGERPADAPAPRKRRQSKRDGVSVYLPSLAVAEAVARLIKNVLDDARDVLDDARPELELADQALLKALARRRTKT